MGTDAFSEALESENNNGEEVERELAREDVEERTDNPPYHKTSDFKELLCCGVFFLLCVAVGAVDISVRQRPIPFQLLGNGIYAENQVNSQEFTGHETVPDSILIVVGIVLPLVLQLGTSKFFGNPGDVHATFCVYFVALGLTLLTTEVLKIYVGYLRPIFYALCEPSQDYSECMASGDSGRKSFPSGHASTSFCGLSLMTFYIHKRFGVTSQPTVIAQAPDGRFMIQYKNGMPHMARLVSVLSLAPMALAAFVAASRVVDNKHFPADVVGGAVLGTVLSVFAHSLWFPSWPM